MNAKLLYGSLDGEAWTVSLGGLVKVERGYIGKNLKARITTDPPCFYEANMARKAGQALILAADLAKLVNDGMAVRDALVKCGIKEIELAEMY